MILSLTMLVMSVTVDLPDFSAGTVEPWWEMLQPCPEGTVLQGRVRKSLGCQEEEGGAWVGRMTDWHENRVPSVERGYRLGRLDGPVRRWFPSGALRSVGQYAAGALEGVEVQCFDGVSPRYVDRDLGRMVVWYENGQKAIERSPQENGEYRIWQSCPKAAQVGYVDGKEHGHAIAWHRTGYRAMEGKFYKGHREGAWMFWRRDGRPHMRGVLAKGMLHGPWEMWDLEGNKMPMQEWKMGENAGEDPGRLTPRQRRHRVLPAWPKRMPEPRDPLEETSATAPSVPARKS